MRSLKDFTDLLVPLQEAYGQLETEYELQRAMLHEKHAENARLRDESRRLRDELELLQNSAFNEPIERDYPHGELNDGRRHR